MFTKFARVKHAYNYKEKKEKKKKNIQNEKNEREHYLTSV